MKALAWFQVVIDGVPQNMKDRHRNIVHRSVAARTKTKVKEYEAKGWIRTTDVGKPTAEDYQRLATDETL